MYTVETTEEFDRWLKSLKDMKTRTRLPLTIFMLCGGDKHSQRRDIAKAHELSRQIDL